MIEDGPSRAPCGRTHNSARRIVFWLAGNPRNNGLFYFLIQPNFVPATPWWLPIQIFPGRCGTVRIHIGCTVLSNVYRPRRFIENRGANVECLSLRIANRTCGLAVERRAPGRWWLLRELRRFCVGRVAEGGC